MYLCPDTAHPSFLQVIFGLEREKYKNQNVDVNFDNFEDNKFACAFLTEAKGPLLTSFAKPGSQNKTGKAADQAFLGELQRESKAKKGGPDRTGWVDKNADQSLKQPGAVYLDLSSLRGKRVFNGVNGGPYGGREIDGKYNDSEVKLIDQDFVDKGNGNCPAFGIRHYAAEVSYDCRGWIEKDKNNPTDEMTACLSSSSDTTFMYSVFSAPPKPGKASVTAAFCTSLKKLITTLGQTDNNFVRCLKASNPLAKRVFQSALVLKQLKYTGMLDTLKIRAFGFPISKDYTEFRGWAKVILQVTIAVALYIAHLTWHSI